MAHQTVYQKRQKELASQGNSSNAVQSTPAVAPKAGITTSDAATATAKEANKTLYNISAKANDPNYVSPYETGNGKYQGSSSTTTNDTTNTSGDNLFSGLFKRISTLQSNLATAQKNEKAAQDTLANNETNSKLNSISSAQEVGNKAKADFSAGSNAINNAEQGKNANTSNINDPFIKSLTESSIASVGIFNEQMTALNQYQSQFNDYTQQDIASIARIAERSVNRQIAENDRVKRAMEFAGFLGGRAQFAPIVENTIINDVIQQGLDKIDIINENKNTAVREARKAEANFNINVFEQQAKLAKDYNDQLSTTFSEMNQQVRQVEKDQRDKIDYRQQQEERSSILLADQLTNATPETIMQTALANGIDPSLLSKAVNDAKFAKTQQDFTTKSNALTLQDKQASINKRNNDIALANAKSDTIKPIDIPKDIVANLMSESFSNSDMQLIASSIDIFGLSGAIKEIVKTGKFKVSEMKGIVSSYEERQRIDPETPTQTETDLNNYIDANSVPKKADSGQQAVDKFSGQTISSTDNFKKGGGTLSKIKGNKKGTTLMDFFK